MGLKYEPSSDRVIVARTCTRPQTGFRFLVSGFGLRVYTVDTVSRSSCVEGNDQSPRWIVALCVLGVGEHHVLVHLVNDDNLPEGGPLCRVEPDVALL